MLGVGIDVNEWAGNLEGQQFDDVTFEGGVLYTTTLSCSGSSTASLATATGIAYFSTLAATAVANCTLTTVKLVTQLLSVVISSIPIKLSQPNKILKATATNITTKISQPNKSLAVIANGIVTVSRTLFKVITYVAIAIPKAFRLRFGVGFFTTITATRKYSIHSARKIQESAKRKFSAKVTGH